MGKIERQGKTYLMSRVIMHSGLPGNRAEQAVRRLLLLLMVTAVLLPIYGPWLDYRFAGWQPAHGHIYTGKVDLNHHRVAHRPHPGHHHVEEAEPAAHGVASVPNQDASYLGLFLPPGPHEAVWAIGQDDTLAFTLFDMYRYPSLNFFPPPERPPV